MALSLPFPSLMLKLPILQKMAWNCSKVRAARAARTARTARLFFPTLPIKFLIGSVVFVVAVGDAESSYHQLLFVLFAKYDHCYDFAISTSNPSCGLFSCRPIRGVGVSYSCA